MQYFTTIVLNIPGRFSHTAGADDQGDAPKALPMALWFTDEILAGAKSSDIKTSLVEALNAGEFASAYDEGLGSCHRYEHAWSPRSLSTLHDVVKNRGTSRRV
jgi:hypothetical protein